MLAETVLTAQGARFSLHAPQATALWLCTFEGTAETRHAMTRHGPRWTVTLPGAREGLRYAYRAEGPHDPRAGLWFDPSKLLTDPAAVELDRPYTYDPSLCIHGRDTAALMPKAILRAPLPPLAAPPVFQPGGLIYEAQVRALTMRHPDIPEAIRGTVAALAHPALLDHLTRLGVDAVEVMPVTAWIDERHLAPLGLSNAWGYNPVTFRALDPRLCPGGVRELRETVQTLRAHGIGTLLDLVFNHTGESDIHGPTLGFRGHAPDLYRHAPDGSLVNDTGTGNTVACDHPALMAEVIATLRHFVTQTGVDGFRFDLAPILGRTGQGGFSPDAALLREMRADRVLADRILIAEPWDIGPGGYALGQFPEPWLEWNDAFRDDLRRFQKGEGSVGQLATRLAGSSDIFAPPATRSVNFVAAHDGFTLADAVSHAHRHNHANGEDNRDGHGAEVSWNNGAEGPTDDPAIGQDRARDVSALLTLLFASRGTIMLTAGDEFGRSQRGNNNAYCQDNEIIWLDWEARDRAREAFAAGLAALRRRVPALRAQSLLTEADVEWLTAEGNPMRDEDWQGRVLLMRLAGVTLAVNGTERPIETICGPVPARSAILAETP